MKNTLRIYIQQIIESNNKIVLGEKHTNKINNVMRMSVGDKILIFNHLGLEYYAKIESIGKKETIIEPKTPNRILKNKDKKNKITLCFAPIKKCKELITHATEMGTDVFQPILTDFTICKPNIEKMKLWCIEASEQCMRLSIPEVLPLMNFVEVFQIYKNRMIICDETSDRNKFMDETKNENHLSNEQNIAITIGPEGGFSKKEKSYKCRKISLGKNILRSETACIAALAALKSNFR